MCTWSSTSPTTCGKPLKRLREYVSVVRRMLAADKPFEHDGEYYHLPFRGDGDRRLLPDHLHRRTRHNLERTGRRHAREHFCLGANLARRSQRALWLELARRMEWAELAGEPEQIHSAFVVGLKKLSMRYRVRPTA